MLGSCGDGYNIVEHECDDGNNNTGDGCDNVCAVEFGWRCYGGTPETADFCYKIS